MSKPIKIVVPPHDVITLNPNDFLASGGEGSVYKKGERLFKIYHTPPYPDLEDKIKSLSRFQHDLVISPISIIQDQKQQLLGFTMKYVKGDPLVKAFTNEWRTQENVTELDTVKLVEKMRDIVRFAHSNQALIVDGNEMNYIVDDDFKPYIIDVDSWQIGKHRATAIMASIRDWCRNDFDQLTDWYSWAVVTFQLFTGIHPYKGRHPDFKMGELTSRVKMHVSVFNKNTRVPQATRDFNTIPRELREWYVSVFEGGQRSIPPLVIPAVKADLTLAAKKYRTVQTGPGSKLVFVKVRDFPVSIVYVFPCGAILLKDGSVYDYAGQHLANLGNTKVDIVAAPISGYLAISEVGGTVNIREIAATPGRPVQRVGLMLACQKIFRKDDRVFAANDTNLTEIEFRKNGALDTSLAVLGKTWQIRNNALFFQGVGFINALGSTYMILPVSISGCSIIRLKELDELVPLQAKYEGNIVSVIAIDRQGQNNKFEFTISDDYSSYSTWCGKTDLSSSLNIVVKGKVGITILDDEELSVFSTNGGATTVIKDTNISTDMRLCMCRGNVHFILDNALWKLNM